MKLNLVDSSVTYELDNFEFMLIMKIWCDILFVVSTLNINFQNETTHTDVAMDIKESFSSYIFFFEDYKEN